MNNPAHPGEIDQIPPFTRIVPNRAGNPVEALVERMKR